MRRLIISALMLTMFSGVALADRDGRRGRREDRRDDRREQRQERREDRRDARQDRRDNRFDNRRPVVVNRNRRAIHRQAIRANNGRYVFHGGHSVTYRRPVIRQRYYDVRYRPQIVVENYDSQPGYLWTAGGWNWNGREWQWTSGYYAPDPQYQNYYDDGSYDYSPGFSAGVTIQGGY